MSNNKKFSLSHVALYAKRWYKRTNNVWGELKYFLELDGHTPYTNDDIYRIILNRYNESIFNGDLYQFLSDTTPDNCWKIGYIHKDSFFNKENNYTNEYDHRIAILFKIISDLMFAEGDKIEIKRPIYSETNPMPDDVTEEKVNRMFTLN